MRFMVIVKANANSEAGKVPDTKLLEEMTRFNEELGKAGVHLAGEGLQASSKGKRVIFSGGRRTVVDGPFPRPEDLVAGFWIWECRSIEEAVEWAKRCPDPNPGGDSQLEIRQAFEAKDFGDALTPEIRARVEKLIEIEKRGSTARG